MKKRYNKFLKYLLLLSNLKNKNDSFSRIVFRKFIKKVEKKLIKIMNKYENKSSKIMSCNIFFKNFFNK